ncbi:MULTISPECIES: beta-ketoacyl-ACP synthase [Brucella/Ochrobactrum group]|jgi:3-oxoacyl-[acyl-carrier-protein] synthase II|uniref:Beta-ketoacyl-ACP synthase n=1 Tax=Brucella pseudintermedia TaxID=370111 RepID=A0ABY5UCW4_9HYPH|nr:MULTISPECIES: beta-ketoacyl-ACP synthase [Brucella/Ochrobactrum group]KAB2680708.1 beta-ketoacyl-ACP synthase [Brucella pseudintermedia]MCO7725899.1 beta-ketoacyl-ACP synthase [Brucella intermedia]NKE77406.1 beta-ketoacyl-ACP synthase [Ochrobactrum sp. MC-1LL]TWG95715.1 3-oxoacyl-[acyl-carrier-protein] synthase II [Ochrobactrum sp. J50]UWL60562.1 beta-ketoacyl-ACP synthase [Brucella pseudintermedia]
MTKYTDHLGRPIVAITGAGVVSSLGQGKEDNWAALTSGKSGIHTITRFPTDNLNTRFSGTVDFLPESDVGASALSEALARLAGEEALAQSGLSSTDFGGPLFLAAPPVELDWKSRFALDATVKNEGPASYQLLLEACRRARQDDLFNTTQFGYIAERLSEAFGTRGLPITLSTACASGATAIQLGVEAIRRGESDRVLSIGTDGSVSAEALIRFSLLSALSTQNDKPEKASKPFSKDRDGFAMSEGSGALVMESLESAVARGAKVLGILAGCGEKADDFHRTRSKPDASPAIGTVRAALADAGLTEDQISYINAHGTSTPENDKMEYLALSSLFGDKLASIPVSSNKSMIGHTLTAAGAIEAVFSLLTIQTGTLPPTINYDNPDPAIPLDVVPNVKRQAEVSAVLSNSFGFGGQNTSLVLAANPN